MEKLLPTLFAVLLVLVVFGLLARGWRSRLKRQGSVRLPTVPEALTEPVLSAEGQYVVTTTAGDWLDRIAAGGLGIRSNAVASVHREGLLFSRSGAEDLFIPAGDLDSVRLERGMAGKFVEKDGLLVVRWRLGERELDTGFRTRAAADKPALAKALETILPAAPGATEQSGKNQ
ncbi:hypothetical protein KIH31_14100 [Paenarthrobacter sp. DKR-5]|uniref:PH-like domain-containing protein n=1 Tax=Paenarthrobacter sp. DKR-5 TaxID=2835535 RepID=UPI001BDCDBC2|nr:hypothetical protein [Paenarthrobacter sp. DKR-5]MBT1003734.1 hypothetical protein [Paenarthrobacter sp. DKR-5]